MDQNYIQMNISKEKFQYMELVKKLGHSDCG